LTNCRKSVDILANHEGKQESIDFPIVDEIMSYKEDKIKKDQLRHIMWENVSIIRTNSGLNDALETINALLNEKIGRLLKFRLLTAREIIFAALRRKESIGVHTIQEEN